jgi:peptide deformylase
VQHEVDHLNGVLFIDHLSRLKRERITRKFVKQARREGDEREARPRQTGS